MSRPMLRRNMVGALRELGWSGRNPDADLRAFQAGWNLGPQLVVDGRNGPKTREALRLSLREHRAGRPDASAHFRFAEFRCRCGGALPGCQLILVDRQLLVGLESYRQAVGRGVDVVSGYRCPERNRRVGGARSSQHLHGRAADVETALSWQRVRSLRRFAGIGKVRRTGKVRHVDVRPGNVSAPTVWDY